MFVGFGTNPALTPESLQIGFGADRNRAAKRSKERAHVSKNARKV